LKYETKHSNEILVNERENNVTSCTKRILPESIVHILIQPLLFI
jgi:hypothetical protein